MPSDPASLAEHVDRARALYGHAARLCGASPQPQPVEFAVLAAAMRDLSDALRGAIPSAEALAESYASGWDGCEQEAARAAEARAAEEEDRPGRHLRVAG
jgi:hypothetical protein